MRPEEVLTIQQQFESAPRPFKPTLLELRVLGASASVRSPAHDTAGDAGVDLQLLERWSADSITGPGETPLRSSLASLHAMAHGRGYEDECLELFVELNASKHLRHLESLARSQLLSAQQKYLVTIKFLESDAYIEYPWNPHWRRLP